MTLRRGRARRPRLEAIEARTLLSGLAFQFRLDDPGGAFASYPLLMADLKEAGSILGSALSGKGAIDVVVRPDATLASPTSGGALSTVVAGTANGMTVLQAGTLSEALSGSDPNGAADDAFLAISPAFLPRFAFDPGTGSRPATVAADRYDFVGAALRGLLRGLGVDGYRGNDPANYGTVSGSESGFDALTAFGAAGDPSVLGFTGAQATAVYGGPVPLTSAGPSDPTFSPANFYHTGNPPGRPGSDLRGDLLFGGGVAPGTVATFGLLDQAILADLGWAVAPAVGFATGGVVDESSGAYAAVLARTGDASQAETVSFATSDLSAQAGVNYAAASGQVRFEAGQSRASIAVPIRADHRVTGDLAFAITLTSTSGPTPLGTPAAQVVRLRDQTTAFRLDPSAPTTVTEDAGTYAIDVVRDSADLSGTATVHYATADGSAIAGVHYLGASGTLTFGPGQVRQTITLTPLQDGRLAGDHDFTIALDSPAGPGDAVAPGLAADVVILDTTTDVSLASAPSAVGEDDGDVAITLVRTGRYDLSPATVHYSTVAGTAAPGVNYASQVGVVSFAAGQATATVRVPVLQDGAVAGDTAFQFRIDHPGSGAVLGPRASATVTIRDTTTVLAIAGPSAAIGEEDGLARFVVTRSGNVASTSTTVFYATADGSALSGLNYAATTGQLQFAAGQTSATISVPVLQDGLAGGDRTFALNLVSPGANAVISAGSATATIRNTTGTVAFLDPDMTVAEDGSFASLRVVKDGTGPATVAFATADGSGFAGVNYVATSGTLRFAAGHDVQTIRIPILRDRVAGPGLAFRVVLTGPTGNVAIADPGARTVTVANVDAAGVSASLGASRVAEAGGAVSATVALTSRPGAPVTVTLASNDGRLAFFPSVVTFTPANWDVAQAVAIAASDDRRRDGGAAASINLVVGGADTQYGAALNRTLSLIVDDPADRAPVLDAIGDVSLNEGDSRTIALSATDPDAGDALSFALAAGTPSWITLVGSSLRIAPPNGPADATVTVAVADDAATPLSATRTFAVHVADLAPTVQAGGDVTLSANRILSRPIAATDAGTAVLSATVDYGDGSGPVALGLDGSRSGILTHTYAAAGSFSVVVRVTDAGGASGVARFQVTAPATVVPAGLAFAAATFSAAETDAVTTITVFRNGDLSGTSTVNFSTSAADALPGSDYQETSGVLTFGPGVASATFPVTVLHDQASLADRVVNLVLSSPTGATLSPSLPLAVLTIRNTDAPTPSPKEPVGGPGSGSGTATSPPPAPVVAPTTVRVVARKGKVSALVVAFSGAIDPATAVDLHHATLALPGKKGKPGKPLPLARASYDSTRHELTLTPRKALAATGSVSLTLDGLKDTLGRGVDGDRNGSAGGTFAGSVGLKASKKA